MRSSGRLALASMVLVPLRARALAQTCPSLFADWIEQLSMEGITDGCS